MLSKLRFRGLSVEDADWITEALNDPEVAKYLGIYPRTEHEIRNDVKNDLEKVQERYVVAELDGEPAGCICVSLDMGRCRHLGWLEGLFVRRKHWGKGVGYALTNEGIKLARELGIRKVMITTTEGNERAKRLYEKLGFKIEVYENDHAYIDGSWRKEYVMGLELSPCKPKLSESSITSNNQSSQNSNIKINVRQVGDPDLDEVHKLQNCPESTKSSRRIPPITKDETKRWYEGLKSQEGKYCLACFENDKLLGYLQFTAFSPPHLHLRLDEIIVDSKKSQKKQQMPWSKRLKASRKDMDTIKYSPTYRKQA